jgi:dihydrofolate synthase/folylpolyglutamate synthase
MPPYAATLRFLFSLHARGMKFGLATTRRLLTALGHPERRFPAVHIAGTNGKGSTSAFLASMFMEGGLRTGLYTSPHLVRFTERIRVNGVEISPGEIVEVTEFLRPLIQDLHATFFEVTTCIAFRHFALQGVDVAVVETGLGGRLDATNVLTPRASIITTIGLDHTELLGSTLTAIAREKGGIIKPGIPCVTGAIPPGPLEVLQHIARQRKAPLIDALQTVACIPAGTGTYRFRLRLGGRRLGIGPVRPGLPGPHQTGNAAAALAAWGLVNLGRSGWRTPAAAERGLARVRTNSALRARCETLRRDRRYILDAAHNPEGMRSFARALRSKGIRNAVVIFGVMRDKDVAGMLDALAPVCRTLIAVRPATPRARTAGSIRRLAEGRGMKALTAPSMQEALTAARRRIPKGGNVAVTGSHYVAGEALALLDNHNGAAYISHATPASRHS